MRAQNGIYFVITSCAVRLDIPLATVDLQLDHTTAQFEIQ